MKSATKEDRAVDKTDEIEMIGMIGIAIAIKEMIEMTTITNAQSQT